jgi:hypothetical protein
LGPKPATMSLPIHWANRENSQPCLAWSDLVRRHNHNSFRRARHSAILKPCRRTTEASGKGLVLVAFKWCCLAKRRRTYALSTAYPSKSMTSAQRCLEVREVLLSSLAFLLSRCRYSDSQKQAIEQICRTPYAPFLLRRRAQSVTPKQPQMQKRPGRSRGDGHQSVRLSHHQLARTSGDVLFK